MKIVQVLVFVMLLHSAVSAQQAWEWVNPAPNGKSVNDAIYTDSVMLAAGSQGLFMLSSDRGLTWVLRDLNHTLNFNSLHFFDRMNGWIAGDGGILFKTTDGGVSFTSVPTGVTEIYTACVSGICKTAPPREPTDSFC